MSAEVVAHVWGDYVVQNDWMAQAKTSSPGPAALHAGIYAACFVPITRDWRALAVIGGTHFVIDRWRLAKHLVWARNQVGPQAYRYSREEALPNGFRPGTPNWLGGWLLFFADNGVHLAINRLALARWGR